MNKLPKRNRGSGPGELKHWSKVEPWPLRLRRGAARCGVSCGPTSHLHAKRHRENAGHASIEWACGSPLPSLPRCDLPRNHPVWASRGGQAGGDRNVKLNPGGEGVNKIVKSNETNAGARAIGTNDISIMDTVCVSDISCKLFRTMFRTIMCFQGAKHTVGITKGPIVRSCLTSV